MKCLHQESTEISNGVGYLEVDFAAAYLVDRFGEESDDISSVKQTSIGRRAWGVRLLCFSSP